MALVAQFSSLWKESGDTDKRRILELILTQLAGINYAEQHSDQYLCDAETAIVQALLKYEEESCVDSSDS